MLKYKLRKIGRKKVIFWSTVALIFVISITSIIRYYAAVSHALTAQASGIVGDTVYVNDLEADYYYYEGLNFTKPLTRNSLPDGSDRKLYGTTDAFTNKLVAVQLTYDGRDVAGKTINGNILTGYVSSSEQQSKYVYYKYYPIENGKIKIELIDNPYTQRPTGYGFNGWYCDQDTASSVSCDQMNFILDNTYYTRYLEIPVNSSTDFLYINLRASWIDAKIATNYATSNTNGFGYLNTFGMKRVNISKPFTNSDVIVNYEYYDNDEQYIAQEGMYRVYRVNQNYYMPAGSFYFNTSAGQYSITATYNENRTRCVNTNGCNYFAESPYSTNPRNNNDDYSYTGDVEDYYVTTATNLTNGANVTFTRATDGSWHQPRIKSETNYHLTINNVNETNFQTVNEWTEGRNLIGYYYKENAPANQRQYYVNANGESCLVATCANGSTYRRIDSTLDYGTWEYITLSTADSSLRFNGRELVENITVRVPKYNTDDFYILTTRDTNIMELSDNTYLGSTTVSKPCTITSNYDGARSDVNLYLGSTNNRDASYNFVQDMVIENINLIVNGSVTIGDTTPRSGVLTINGHNVKLGRNLKSNDAFASTGNTGYTANNILLSGSGNTDYKSKTIVESGRYNCIFGTRYAISTSDTTAQMRLQLGSDYDRVSPSDRKLVVEMRVAAYCAGYYSMPSNNLLPIFENLVKSGTIGRRCTSSTTPTTYNSYYTYGIYVGGTGGNANNPNKAYKTLIVEGGRIFCINGGPTIDASSHVSIGIFIKGGVIENIVGGAGASESAGDRIVSVTGGKVNISVAGGSNSSDSSGSNIGPLNADTLVYIGGYALIGDSTSNLFSGNRNLSIAGNVYGAGLGSYDETSSGRVNNSHVVINGGTINGDVYGGGNYGYATKTKTVVDILNGQVNGNVFGAANNRGFSTANGTSGETTGTCDCGPAGTKCLTTDYRIDGGKVNNRSTIPAGEYTNYSDINGRYSHTSYGYTNCSPSDGRGRCTIVSVVEAGTVYNPSLQYYIKNGNYYATVDSDDVQICTVPTSGEGSSSNAPGIHINMSGGTVGKSVYGGSNSEGTVYSSVYVNMTGGIVTEDVFGGGLGEDTYVRDNIEIVLSEDIKARNVYGGSSKGVVNNTSKNSTRTSKTTTIEVNGGEFTAIYGNGKGENGRSYPYTNGQTTVTFNDGVTNYIYGGNDASGSSAYPTNVILTGGTVNNDVFGGGNNVGHSETNVKLDGTDVHGAIYGGSNQSGNVTTTNVTINNGSVGDVFGGNNAGGTVTTSKVIIDPTELVITGDVYGSGNQASTTTTNVTVKDGDLNNVYGGGKQANANIANVLFENGAASEVYGGSNKAGTVGTSNVYITNGTISHVFGGNNIAGQTNTTNVYIGNGVFETIYGGGQKANTPYATNVHVYGGIMDNVFGGGSEASVTNDIKSATTSVFMYGGTSGDIYGGSNTSGEVSNTEVNIVDTIPACTAQRNPEVGVVYNPCYSKQARSLVDVYGGNNAGGNAINTIVNIKDTANVNDVFGGGNNAPVDNSTTVNMYAGTAKNIYGGGNKSYVGQANVSEGVFMTGISPGTTTVNVANGTINNNLYGSSNASFIYGDTYVYVGDKALQNLNSIDPSVRITNPSITVKGSVFGGSETNASEATTYDDTYKGVQGNSNVYVGAASYDNTRINITGSLFGSGNNSSTSGVSTIYVNDFGTSSNIKSLASIQRSKYVYLTNSSIELQGQRDRALLTKYLYGLIRIEYLYLLSNGNATTGTNLHMNAGNAYVQNYYSGKMNTTDLAAYNNSNFVAQETDISDTGVVTNTNSNNKLFMHTNVAFSIVNNSAPIYENGTDKAGEVKGMTYLGMYTSNGTSYEYGLYDSSITSGSNIASVKENISSSAYTFVYGKHTYDPDYQIENNGFYSHYEDEENPDTLKVDYVGVTPLNSTYYKWMLGEEPLSIDVSLQATKSTVEGAHVETINLSELKEMVGGTEVDWRDATMQILSIDTTSFGAKNDVVTSWDAMLVDKTEIPVVATGSETINGYEVTDANRYFALSVGTTTSGWLNNYKTNLYDNGSSPEGTYNFCSGATGECSGSNIYTYDSTSNPRSLSFWLYYSKNLDFSLSTADESEEIIVIPLGNVYVTTEFINPHGDPTSTDSTRKVVINIDISMVYNKKENYAASIIAGKQYEMFETGSSTITEDGAVSVYQMLSVDLKNDTEGASDSNILTANRLYATEETINGTRYSAAYRYLKSNYKLPVGTVITMLDLKDNKQYYYEITNTNQNEAATNAGDYKYRLDRFVLMGNTSNTSNVKFDDDMHGSNSTKYFTANPDGSGIAVEEFIFTVDFSEAVGHSNYDTHSLYLQIGRDVLNSSDAVLSTSPILGPSGTPDTDMTYKVYQNVTSSLNTNGYFVDDLGQPEVDSSNNPEPTSFYKSEEKVLELNTKLLEINSTNGQVVTSVVDTTFDDYKLGAKITVLQARKDASGNPVYSDGEQVYDLVTTNLFGSVVTINGNEYYPQTDGSIRLSLAGRITDVLSDVKLDFSNSDLEYGDYKLLVETFASYDGLYYGDFTPTRNEFYFTVLNNEYGIDVSLPPVEVTHDSNTGKDKDGNLDLTYSLITKNGLANPNVKVHLERRVYGSSYYDTQYTPVSLEGVATSLNILGEENVLTSASCFARLANNDCYIYNLTSLNNDLVEQEMTVEMTMKEGPTADEISNPASAKWKSGTYRLVFEMYDGNVAIGSAYEYLIIRSLDVDEEIEGS